MTGSARAHPFPFVHTAAIEVTSRCNLRCTYCAVSQPGYRGLDMSPSLLEGVLTELRGRRLDQLCINGHGETTMRPGWHELFEGLIEEFRISIITNLARPLPPPELHFLSRIDSLNLSLDTTDPALLRRVRRALDLEVVLSNLEGVRSAAWSRDAAGPRLVLYAGVYDESVRGLEDLARFAASRGFAHVIFWSLVKHADIDDGLNVRPIFALGAEARTEARRTIDRAVRILGEAGLTYEFTGSFFDVFKERAPGSSEGALATSVAVGAPSTNLEAANRIYARAPEGWTRECFDPWNYVQIKANGDVYPCCTHSAIGRIEGERGLGAVLDGEILARLREGLLSGHLDEECRNCHLRAFIPVVDYQKRYADVFGADPFRDHPIVAPPWTSSTTGATTRRRFTRGLRASMLRWRARLSGRTIIGRLDAPPTGIVSSRTLQVRGWAFSTRRQSLSGVVAVNGAVRSQIATRYPRADVRAALGTSVPLACGFAATLELPESLQPGESCRVEVSFQDEGGARLEFPASFLTLVDSRPFGP